jgi:hypothetical protein
MFMAILKLNPPLFPKGRSRTRKDSSAGGFGFSDQPFLLERVTKPPFASACNSTEMVNWFDSPGNTPLG